MDADDRIRQRAGGVGTAAQDDPHVGHFPQGGDQPRAIPQDRLQKLKGFQIPHQKGGLQRDLDAEVGALLKSLFGGKAGVDDPVAVILPGEILQGGLDRHDRLVEGRIADRMHLDLQPLAVGPLRELNHLFIAVEEDAAILGTVGVRLSQRRILAAEAAVQGRGKASTHPGKLSLPDLVEIHGLEEESGLKTAVEPLSKDRLQGHIQIERETDARYSVHHSNPLFRHCINRLKHVPEGPRQRDLFGDEIGGCKKGLLVHLPRVFMPAPQRFHFIRQHRYHFAVQDAGVAVIFDDEDRPVRTGLIELVLGYQPLFLDGVSGRPEPHDDLVVVFRCEFLDMPAHLRQAPRMAYIKTRVEQGVGCKVQVSVSEAGKKGPFTQNLPWGALIRRGKLISQMKNPPFVFHKVSVNMIFPITGDDCAFICFHRGWSPISTPGASSLSKAL